MNWTVSAIAMRDVRGKKWVPLSLPPRTPLSLALRGAIFAPRHIPHKALRPAVRHATRDKDLHAGPVLLSAMEKVLIWGGIRELWETYA